MAKKYSVTTYEFSELSGAAKKHALAWMRKLHDETFETQPITDMFCQKLEELGYPNNGDADRSKLCRRDSDRLGTVEWSLGYCQGDGVAFYGPVDLPKVAKRLLTPEKVKTIEPMFEDGSLSVTLVRNSFGHHYSHYNTMAVNDELTFNLESEAPAAKVIVDELITAIQADVKTVSKELESMGYKEIEYQGSDEQLIESIEANDYEFYKDGRRADEGRFDGEDT